MRILAMIALVAALAGCDVFVPNIGGLGEPCSDFGECYGDLVCVYGTCSETPGLGEECDDSYYNTDEACEDGLWCIDGQCVEAGGVGQPCIPEEAVDCWEQCEDGAYCVDGQCVAMDGLGGEGEPCVCLENSHDCEPVCEDWEEEIAACDDGLLCADWTCDGPSEDYVVQPDTDKRWKRCPVGMTWDGWRCTGTATRMAWSTAMSSCPSGYHLPYLDDFIALLGGCIDSVLNHEDTFLGMCNTCAESAACSAMFSDDNLNDPEWENDEVNSTEYWTRDGPDDPYSDAYAYSVDFGDSGYNVHAESGDRELFAVCVQ